MRAKTNEARELGGPAARDRGVDRLPRLPLERLLAPAWRSDLLSRDRLVRRLARSVDAQRLTAICAPAGYGKTTLLADYVRQSGRLCIWLRLEDTDRDPADLLRALSEAAHVSGAEYGATRETQAEDWWWRDSGAVSAVALANRIASRHADTVVVFDDLHTIAGSPAAIRTVRQLARLTPEHVRLVVSSRHAVPAALGQLGPLSGIAPLDSRALRFTRDETEELLEGLGVPVDVWPSQLEQLAICEGWPAAVALAVKASLLGDSDSAPGPEVHARLAGRAKKAGHAGGAENEGISGSTGYTGHTGHVGAAAYVGDTGHVGDAGQVFEALAASFVEGLDEEDRSLLHEAAHLERITPELCEVCLGLSDAQARLRRIAAMNLFLDHRPGDDVYRMHGLFKRYLTEGGTASRPFGAEQHRLAAESFRNSSDVVAEIRHWVAAGDLERACARLVEEAPALALAARWHTLADLVTRFEMANDGELPVALARYMAKAQVAVGDAKAAVATITRAVGLPDLSEEDLVALYITRSYAHRSWGAMDRALRDAESALGHAEVLGPAERVRALRVIGQTHASELHLSVAGRCFAEAIELAERHHLARARAMLALDLAAYDLLCGRIDEAKESALLAASLGDELNYVDAQLFARNNLAAALHLGGDYTTAHDVFEEVLRDARRHGHRRVEALAWLGQGDLRSDLKLADSAEQCFQRGLALAREMGDADLIAYALRSLASHHRAAGDLAESRRLLSDPDAREPRADKHSNILHAIADAALRLGEGNSAMAIDQLREAAETLASAGALVSLAHAQLHLSHALFISEGIAAAVPTLESLVVTIREIGSHQFLALPADGMPRMWGALDAAGRPDLRISITEPDLRPRISPQLRGLPPTARPDDPHPRLLSPRERELVIALCEGLTRDAIADRVGLSRSTIDKTISGAYASTGFRHAYQLVGWAFRCGLFDLSDPPPPQTATHL